MLAYNLNNIVNSAIVINLRPLIKYEIEIVLLLVKYY